MRIASASVLQKACNTQEQNTVKNAVGDNTYYLSFTSLKLVLTLVQGVEANWLLQQPKPQVQIARQLALGMPVKHVEEAIA